MKIQKLYMYQVRKIAAVFHLTGEFFMYFSYLCRQLECQLRSSFYNPIHIIVDNRYKNPIKVARWYKNFSKKLNLYVFITNFFITQLVITL